MTDLSEISSACRYLLNNFSPASPTQQYFNQRLSARSQEQFQLGYFPPAEQLSSLLQIVGEDSLKQHQLFYSKTLTDALSPRTILFSYFEHYPMIIPFRDAYGKTIALAGRTLLSESEYKAKHLPKYKNTSFLKNQHLFGLFENQQYILDQNRVFIVEGQFDVIKAKEKGLHTVVAVGSNNLSAYQFSLIMRYTNNIFLLLDNDEAGEKGRKRAIEKFGSYASLQNVYLPEEYKDLDEFFADHQLEDLRFITKN